jgi:hypothetical protein
VIAKYVGLLGVLWQLTVDHVDRPVLLGLLGTMMTSGAALDAVRKGEREKLPKAEAREEEMSP